MERTLLHPERAAGGPGSGLFDTVEDVAGLATVSHGPFAEELPVAGETVGRVRQLYADRLDLDPLSQAIIDGEEVGDDTIVATGQHLLFAKRAGEKGRTLAARCGA